MKFKTSREALLRPLRVVTGVVERRQTLPVLANLLVEADEGGLMLRGTDLEVEVVARVADVDVEQSGATTIPAHKLSEIWQSLGESADITVELDGDRAVVRSGRSRFALATIPASDFPTDRPLLQGEAGAEEPAAADVELTLPHSDVCRLLDRTKFAMANQDVRYFLNGMLLELSANSLRAAASDGHRMAMCTLPSGAAGVAGRMRLIVPRKSVQDLERLIQDSDLDIHLSFGSSYLRVSQGEYTLTTKLVDGQFPEVDRLVPASTDHSITSDRESLRQSLHRASILSNDRSQEVRLEVSGETMAVRASNPERDEAEDEVAVEFSGDKPMEIGFNARYIQDVLQALDVESVKMSMPENNNIALIEGLGDEDSLYLVMPLRR